MGESPLHHSGRFTSAARLRSIWCAARGVAVMLRTQHNAWLHAATTAVVVSLGLWLRLGRLEWCAVVLAGAAVWVAEALNTALELLADAACQDFHPLIGRAKDVAAGAVLLCAAAAALVGLLVLGPHLWAAVGGPPGALRAG